METIVSSGFSATPKIKGEVFNCSLSVLRNSDGDIEVSSGILLANEFKDDDEIRKEIEVAIKATGFADAVKKQLLTIYYKDDIKFYLDSPDYSEEFKTQMTIQNDNIKTLLDTL